VVDSEEPEAALFPERVGDRLRAARIRAGLDLADVATKTRVPLRHLEGIEAGDYSKLPSSTYCIGFVKAYARAVGADETSLAHDVRRELDLVTPEQNAFVEYEITDPARVPSRVLAWTGGVIFLLVLIGFAIWRSQMAADPRDAEPITVDAGDVTAPSTSVSAPVSAPPTPLAATTGPVMLTATKAVWLKIYEAGGKRIFEKELAVGESYTVPADAVRPQILTGRPEALRVTVGGKEVAPLGPPERTVSDLDISASALAARAAPAVSQSVQPTSSAQP
jgi:cytoskeleton protein RodZ